MLLIKTFSQKVFDNYSDYLFLLYQREWTTVRTEVKTKIFDDFDSLFTTNLQQKNIELDDDVYKITCSYDPRRYVYIEVKNHKIMNVLFDYIQFHEVAELIELENMKLNILREKAVSYYNLEENDLNSENEKEIISKFEMLNLVEWDHLYFLNGSFQ